MAFQIEAWMRLLKPVAELIESRIKDVRHEAESVGAVHFKAIIEGRARLEGYRGYRAWGGGSIGFASRLRF